MNEIYNSQIIDAITSSRPNELEKLLKTDEGQKCLSYRDRHDKTLLHICCKFWCKLEIVSILVKAQQDALFEVDTLGETPLHKVCSRGTVGVLKLFLKYQGVKNLLLHKSKLGQTPLHMASSTVYRYDIVKEILKYPEGQQSLSLKCFLWDTPLHRVCITKGNTIKLKEMLKHRLARDTLCNKNFLGQTPLHLICSIDNNPEMLEEILKYPEARKALDIQDNRKDTPTDLVFRVSSSTMKRIMVKTMKNTLLQSIIHDTLY